MKSYISRQCLLTRLSFEINVVSEGREKFQAGMEKMKLLQPTVGVRHRLKLSLGVSFASQTGNFFKNKNKKVKKNGFSFQSGPNPMSFAFKRGGRY